MSAKFVGITSLQVVFSENVNAVVADFTNFKYTNDSGTTYTSRAITGISGSGTNIIIVSFVIPAIFDGNATTGTIDIGNGVVNLAGTHLVEVTEQQIEILN
ncbi:MAG: hypothetical protein CVU99_07365 [Firmicutes bacterium HGW-Firmicutes-4]|jgi:hypothetical protein|nr:MAG: hypothetical protein CVU99_07365 [Firmicutes bacterium HGW-Firmicutes-4]